MMNSFQQRLHRISHRFAVLTDWILIVLGALLIVVAASRIDVAVARYGVEAAGVIVAAIGFWFRFHRLRRKTSISKEKGL